MDGSSRYIVNDYGGCRSFRKYSDDNKVIETDGSPMIRYDSSDREVITTYNNGEYCELAYDTYGNLVAEFRTDYGRMRINKYRYTTTRSGRVESTYLSRREYDDYWKWREAIPATFEVEPAAQTATQAREVQSLWGNYVVRDSSSYRLFEWTPPVLAREEERAGWATIDEASFTSTDLERASAQLMASENTRRRSPLRGYWSGPMVSQEPAPNPEYVTGDPENSQWIPTTDQVRVYGGDPL